MATKADKKNAIRQGIIDSAGIYIQSLAGKTFLYVYGEEFFEVSFPIDHFLHLTGVETKLSAKDFYKNAKKAKLTSSQFYFDARHPYANARKKLPCLKRLPELTNDMVCILKEMQTVTIIYKLSVTNLEFTLGLTENTDVNGKKINDFFLPMSLRVEDTSVEKSNDGEIVDFIFSKDASVAKYDTLLVEDKNKMIPDSNFIIHRVQNPDDLKYISRMVPYINSNMIERLTYLQTGNALVFGTAINIPTLTRFDQARPATDSENAKITEKWYVEWFNNPLGTKGALQYLPIGRYWCAFSHTKPIIEKTLKSTFFGTRTLSSTPFLG